jgi:exonuclease SbcC
MKILAIRGLNLASLSGEFEINLNSEPLAGTGLFAITGEIGSGKSTILDALCLALYGSFPRLKHGKSEWILDPSGEMIPASDPRNILQRGKGAGFAEVDFIGNDGRTYQARWEVNRARKRANGTLQQAIRRLSCLDDGSVVAGSINEVKDKVPGLTGLTYEQFCKTALLAQGEFDQFLDAANSERGDLLEKITGTEIYAQISAAVFATTKQEQDALSTNKERYEALNILPAEQRAALEQEAERLSIEVKEKQIQADEITASLQFRSRVRAVRNDVKDAEIEVQNAQDAADAAVEGRLRLEKLKKADTLRASYGEIDKAKEEVKAAETAAAAALSNFEKAQGAEQEARDILGRAITTEAAARAQCEAYEPEWNRAGQLDAEIDSQNKVLQDAKEKWGNAQESELIVRDQLVASRLDEERLSSDIQTANLRLSELALTFPIADRLDETLAGIREYKTLSETEAKIAKESARLTGEVQRANRKVANSVDLVPSFESQAQKLKSRIAELDSQLKKLNGPALRKKLADLVDLEARLGDAERTASDTGEARDQEAASKQKKTAAEKIIRTKTSALQQHEQRNNQIEAALAGLDAAALAISDEAEKLRLQLKDGQPCSVCGSLAHPYMKSGAKHLSESAKTLKRQRKPLEQEREQLNSLIKKIMSEIGKASSTIDRAKEDILEAQAGYCNAKDEFKNAIQLASVLANRLKLKLTLPSKLTPTFGEQAEQARTVVNNSRKTVDASLKSFDQLSDEIGRNRKQADLFASKIKEARDRETSARESRDALQGQLSQCERDLAKAQADLANNLKQVLPVIGLLHLGQDKLTGNPDAVVRRLSAHADEIRRIRAVKAENEKALAECQPRIAGLTVKQDAEEQRVAGLLQELERQDCLLSDLRSERGPLLGGEATEAHRLRYRGALKKAQDDLGKFQEIGNAASQTSAGCQEIKEYTSRTLENRRNEFGRLKDEFRQHCSNCALLAEEATELLLVPKEEVERLTAKLEFLDARVGNARITLALRRKDLDGVGTEAESVPDDPGDDVDLNAALAALNEARDAASQATGVILTQLSTDDKVRKDAKGLRDRIAELEASCAIWREINEAIGSQKGDKFRIFAQSITLEQLIRIANRDLESIAPRYRLAKGGENNLALHIVDRDMESEMRSTRSLSGGERFLVSLALALALSSLTGCQSFVDTLFIDEGFGSLDTETLDTAMAALERIQNFGRKVGIITHLDAIKERLPVQVVIEKLGAGRSRIRAHAA